MAFLVLGEVPRVGQLAGIAVILAGVLLLHRRAAQHAAQAFGWAIALLLLAALIRGLVQPVVKLGLEAWPNPFAATLIGYLVSATVILSVGASREGQRASSRPAAPAGSGSCRSACCNGLAMLGDVCRPGAADRSPSWRRWSPAIRWQRWCSAACCSGRAASPGARGSAWPSPWRALPCSCAPDEPDLRCLLAWLQAHDLRAAVL